MGFSLIFLSTVALIVIAILFLFKVKWEIDKDYKKTKAETKAAFKKMGYGNIDI